MENQISEKLKRAVEIGVSIREKEKFHWKKWERARKRENQEFHFKKWKLYTEHERRFGDFSWNLRHERIFGVTENLLKMSAARYIKLTTERKEEARLKFEASYRIELWFIQASFTADYGQFNCDKCGRVYYHSPSYVYKGKEELHKCCCGYCVNTLMRWNKGEVVFN